MIRISQYQEVTRFDLARTILGRGRYWTTAYLIDGILIDTGCAHANHEFLQALQDTHIDRIINTHTHEDHIGNNGDLQRLRPGLIIQAHPMALPVIADPCKMQPLHLYRRFFWGWPKSAQAEALENGAIVHSNDFNLQVIYTPGHSADHISLYEPVRGWLFSGDLFTGGRDRALRAGYDIWGIIESLKRINELPITILFPGCAKVRSKPLNETHEKITYLENFGQNVLDLAQHGWNVHQIAQELCGGPMWVEFVTLGHFSRKQLILSYLRKDSI